MENGTRRGIVETLEQTPGMNQHQIARALDTSPRMVHYHMERLLDAGLVVERDSAQDNEFLYFLPDDEHHWHDERTRILFGREGPRRVALYLAEHPGATTQQIADDVGVSVEAVRWNMRILQEYMLAVKARIGSHEYEYHATTPLRKWARTVGPRYEGSEAWAATP